jgi:beta-glucosidase
MPATAIADRELAREAVRGSLVLLKNDGRALPLASNARVLVVGRGADSLARQSGGWSRTWQGDDNPNEMFGTGETFAQALTRTLGAANVVYRETAEGVDVRGFDAVIAVLAEEPYAEGRGDITWPRTLSHAERYPEDLRVLRGVAEAGVPVVTILYSGRTLYANDLINASDAFVAAWLPGSEAQGIVDLLVAGANGRPAYDFTGRLPFAWPGDLCDSVGRAAQFPVGYGLTYARPRNVGVLREAAAVATCEH